MKKFITTIRRTMAAHDGRTTGGSDAIIFFRPVPMTILPLSSAVAYNRGPGLRRPDGHASGSNRRGCRSSMIDVTE